MSCVAKVVQQALFNLCRALQITPKRR